MKIYDKLQYHLHINIFQHLFFVQSFAVLLFIEAPYFHEKYINISALFAIITCVVAIKKRSYPILILLAFCLGIIAMHINTKLCNTTFLNEPIKNIEVVGKVVKIKQFETKQRVTVKMSEDNEMSLNLIRVTTSYTPFKVGDTISFKANLFPPPHSILEDGFDFHFYFFFKKISAVGYILRNSIEVLNLSKPTFFSHYREMINKTLYKNLPKQNAALLASLIIGNSNGLSKNLKEKIRYIGIAHVFAVSGMHMGIIIVWVFFSLRFAFRFSERLLLNHNPNKIASLLALLFGLFYLALTDFAISAIRAYIMSSILMLAVIFERRTDPFRSLSLAGCVMLLIMPESLLSPSMQMSFAACAGLVLAYDKLVIRKLVMKKLRYFSSLLLTTFVACIATMPFSIYHFQHFSATSLISNSIIIPFTEFILMPLCLLYIILTPIKLDILITFLAKIITNSVIWLIELLYSFALPDFFIYKPHYISIIGFAIILLFWKILRAKYLIYLSIALMISQSFLYYQSARYNVVYKPQTEQIVYIKDDVLLADGKFSPIEIKMLESHYDKNLTISDLKDLRKELILLKKDGISTYMLTIDKNNAILSSKIYKTKSKPWR